MAKGDNVRARNKLNHEGGLAQNHLDNMRNDMVIPQAQDAQNWYTNAKNRSWEDYGNLMSGFGEFQKTGGYGEGDLSNIRARGLSPMRAVYANANRDIDRQRRLQGGYSPNYTASKAKMAREMSSGLSDQATNIEAQIAQMVNAGKQFGLSGGSNLYGTSPGLANHYGSMQNQTMNNWLQSQGLQQDLGLGLINAQINAGQMQGKGQQAYNNILNGINTVSGMWKIGGK